MANEVLKPYVFLILLLNFCMYVIVFSIGGWAMNKVIDYGFIAGQGLELPAQFSHTYFTEGNAAVGLFVMFALVAGVVGAASLVAGLNYIRSWNLDGLPSAISVAAISWTLTVLATGFACKDIELNIRDARLITMKAFLIILSATQLLYIVALHGSGHIWWKA